MGLLRLSSLLLVSTLTVLSSGSVDAHTPVHTDVDLGYDAFGQQPLHGAFAADPPEPSGVLDFRARDGPDAEADTEADAPGGLQSLAMHNSTRDPSGKFHVFTAPDFANGRGISIITTEDRIAKFRQIKPAPDVNENPSPPPFEKRDIPGKGRGLVASRMIYRGDRIFVHKPLVVVDAQVFNHWHGQDGGAHDGDGGDDNDNDAVVRALQEEAVAGLPAASQGMFWELYGEPGRHPVDARVEANSFNLDMGDHDTAYYAVFPEPSRLNHDCRPNLAYFVDNNTLTHHVHAITDIPPGAEISISYIDMALPRQTRLQYLHRTWGFNCSCSQCSLAPALARASDSRLALIQDLMDRFAGGAFASAATAERLVDLFRLERLHAAVSEAYAVAAVTNCFEGRHGETLHWAHLALDAALLTSGPRSEGVVDMMQLVEAPEKHKCWLSPLKRKVPRFWD
ncbi:hypothetical protein E4U21_005412 [Claviceps maximensis]|nr:hypothetical protein E4U21_005412 [Claviceps maximensis]